MQRPPNQTSEATRAWAYLAYGVGLTGVLVALVAALVPDGPWKQAVIIALLAALIILLGYIVQYLAATTATVQTFNARAQSFIHDQWNLGETDSTTIFSRLTRLYDLLRARKIDVLVTDRGDRYRIMANILDDKRCTAIFLIQASSSLLLGPGDDGAKEEKLFLDKLRERISSGVDFRYVVSLLGTTAHYRRWSNFRALASARDFLKVNDLGIVCVEGSEAKGQSERWQIKKLKGEKGDMVSHETTHASAETHFKHIHPCIFMVAAENEDGEKFFDGVLTFKFPQGGGPIGFQFQSTGTELQSFYDSCVEFYDYCDFLSKEDVEAAIPSYWKAPVQLIPPTAGAL